MLDLTEYAQQPMVDPRRGNVLVYNGELYNFREIRKRLESMGEVFSSTGDTEVVLKALGRWGETALERFEGMFALAFWQAESQRLMLARDPFGIKPILYSDPPTHFLFASELRGIRAANIVDESLDETAIDSFLFYGAVIEPRTILSSVKVLPPGHILWSSNPTKAEDARRVAPFPKIFPDARDVVRVSQKEAIQTADKLLASAVDSQLVSDVPVGLAFSGGIDSTLLATYAIRSPIGADVRLITVDSGEPGYSEGRYAQQAARVLGRSHHMEHLPSSELLRIIPRAIEAMDQPTIDGVNTFIISGAAARLGVRVLLSGLGGDELFGGYTTFLKVPALFKYSKVLARSGRLISRIWPGIPPQLHKLAQSHEIPSFTNAYLLQRAMRWENATGSLTTLPPGPPRATGIPGDAMATLDPGPAFDSYRRVAAHELFFYMRNQLLRDSDIFSSALGIEMRVPFLDSRLAKYALRLPGELHVNGLQRKKLLRHLVLLRHGKSIPFRPKMGFLLPWEIWLRGPLYQEIDDTITSDGAFGNLPIRKAEVVDMLRGFRADDPLIPWQQVWSLYTLAKKLPRAA